jgi:hypothetical protein
MRRFIVPLAKYPTEELRAMMVAAPGGLVQDAPVEIDSEDQESGSFSECP